MSFIDGPAYVALPRSGEWVIEDLLPVNGFLNIFGQPKQGKSFLALQLAQAIADPTKDEVLGFPILNHGPVAYLQIDTPRGIWASRLEDLQALGNPFNNVKFADSQLVPYPFNILGEGFGWLKQNLKLLDPFPVAVIIDTLREVHGGDENDSGHMRNVINLIAEAVRPAACVLLTHARKEFAGGDQLRSGSDLMSENRGSGYVAGRMDCVLKVNAASLLYQGRTVGEARVIVKRDEMSGFFVLSDDFDRVARDIIDQNADLSQVQMAKLLQERFPKRSVDACRSVIRRLMKIPAAPKSRRTRAISLEETDYVAADSTNVARDMYEKPEVP